MVLVVVSHLAVRGTLVTIPFACVSLPDSPVITAAAGGLAVHFSELIERHLPRPCRRQTREQRPPHLPPRRRGNPGGVAPLRARTFRLGDEHLHDRPLASCGAGVGCRFERPDLGAGAGRSDDAGREHGVGDNMDPKSAWVRVGEPSTRAVHLLERALGMHLEIVGDAPHHDHTVARQTWAKHQRRVTGSPLEHPRATSLAYLHIRQLDGFTRCDLTTMATHLETPTPPSTKGESLLRTHVRANQPAASPLVQVLPVVLPQGIEPFQGLLPPAHSAEERDAGSFQSLEVPRRPAIGPTAVSGT